MGFKARTTPTARVAVVKSPAGLAVYINDYRVAGPKPFGESTVVNVPSVDIEDIDRALDRQATPLTNDQIQALVDFANEGDRKGGCTAWGPKFDAVMNVAQAVRKSVNRRLK